MNLIETAVARMGGITAFTKALNTRIGKPVTYQAVRKWVARGRLPRTEWTGETQYASAIESITEGQVLRIQLLNSRVLCVDASDEHVDEINARTIADRIKSTDDVQPPTGGEVDDGEGV